MMCSPSPIPLFVVIWCYIHKIDLTKFMWTILEKGDLFPSNTGN